MRRCPSLALLAAGGTLCLCQSLFAQTWPARPVTIVVPFATGGANDVIGRAVANGLSLETRQTVVVENLPSAGGIVGTQKVANAKPDGTVFGIGSSSSFGTAPVISKALPYNVERDFTPISELATIPLLILVNPNFPARNYDEFIRLVKAAPGKYAYASAGPGTLGHLGMEYFKAQAGVNLLHIPYKGAGQAQIDVMSGQVPVLIENVASSMVHIKDGKLRPLVVAFNKRLPDLPDVPVMREIGLANLELDAWIALMGPPGMSAELLATVHAATIKAMQRQDVRQRLENGGYYVRTSSPQELSDKIKRSVATWRKVAADAKLVFE